MRQGLIFKGADPLLFTADYSLSAEQMAATAIAAVVLWMDDSLEYSHTIAVDGSLFLKYPGFRAERLSSLVELLGDRSERIKFASALKLEYPPVAILWSDEKPADALGFKEGKWGCVMWMLVGAARGKTAAFDESTCGGWGGGVGLGFGNQYQKFPGGIDCFCRFLSTGNADSQMGRAVAKKIEPFVDKDFLGDFLHGEKFMVSPEQVRGFVEGMPIMQIPATCSPFPYRCACFRRWRRKSRAAFCNGIPGGRSRNKNLETKWGQSICF
jgi:hypothetical protein